MLKPPFCGEGRLNEHRRAERWTALNYTSHYPFSRSKARSQQLAQIHVTKIPNQVCWECADPDHGCPRTPARHSSARISFSLHCFPRSRARQRCAPPKRSFSLILREWTSSNSSKSKQWAVDEHANGSTSFPPLLPPPPLSSPQRFIQLVASSISLYHCRFITAASSLSLHHCRFITVTMSRRRDVT